MHPNCTSQGEPRDEIAGVVLSISVAGLAEIVLHDAANAFVGYDLLYGQDYFGPYLVRGIVFVALGFALTRFLGIRFTLASCFAVAGLVSLLDVASQGAIGRFGLINELYPGGLLSISQGLAVPVAVWTLLALLGAILSRTRLLRSPFRGHVYRVKV